MPELTMLEFTELCADGKAHRFAVRSSEVKSVSAREGYTKLATIDGQARYIAEPYGMVMCIIEGTTAKAAQPVRASWTDVVMARLNQWERNPKPVTPWD